MIVKENLRYTNKAVNYLVKIFISALLLLLIYGIYQSNRTMIWVATAGIMVLGMIYFLVFQSKLSTEFTEKGISYHFFPFTMSTIFINMDQINSIDIQDIDPLGEFGGYGLRIKKNIKAYLTRKETVRIDCKNGQTIFLSIADVAQVRNYLSSLQTTY